MDRDVWDISKDYRERSPSGSLFSFLVLIVLVVGDYSDSGIASPGIHIYKRMNRLVMEPLDCLVEGAKRIQDGNLEEEIVYEGQEEFERVCRAFNEMQRTILEDQKIRERNEKARTDMVTGILSRSKNSAYVNPGLYQRGSGWCGKYGRQTDNVSGDGL